MANLKDLKKRIRSIKNTSKTTRAMKLVSASKLRRAKDQLDNLEPYFKTVQEQAARLLAMGSSDVSRTLFLQSETKRDRELIIVVGADKGLCGSYNSSIFKALVVYMGQKKAEGQDVDIVAVGKKITDILRIRKIPAYKSINDFWKQKINSKSSENFLKDVIVSAEENYDKIVVLYTHFKSAISTKAQVLQLYPLTEVEFEKVELEDRLNPGVIEPNVALLSAKIFEQYLQSKFYFQLLNSQASEHGSRMAAMDSATRNAKEIMEQLTLTYNRKRQEAITKELIDIVGGAEAV